MSCNNLNALALAAARGDDAAFERLVTATETMVYNLARRSTVCDSDAADLTQEIYIKVWRSLGSFRGDASFTTWLYRVAQNAACDAARRAGRRPTVSLTVDGDDDETEVLAVPDDAPSPEEHVLAAERATGVRAALDALTDEHRAVLTMRDIDGLSYEQIAALLALDMGTVKSRLFRARRQFKKILTERNLLPDGCVECSTNNTKENL